MRSAVSGVRRVVGIGRPLLIVAAWLFAANEGPTRGRFEERYADSTLAELLEARNDLLAQVETDLDALLDEELDWVHEAIRTMRGLPPPRPGIERYGFRCGYGVLEERIRLERLEAQFRALRREQR